MRLLDEDRRPSGESAGGEQPDRQGRARYAKAIEDSAFGAVLHATCRKAPVRDLDGHGGVLAGPQGEG